jgi:hypothetical protein
MATGDATWVKVRRLTAARHARADEFGRAAWHRPMASRPRQPSQSTVTKAQCTDQRSEGSLGVWYGGGRRGAPGATSCACTHSRRWNNSDYPVWPSITPKIWTKVPQDVISKVVDLVSLYNFYKGHMAFFLNQLCTNCMPSWQFSGRWWIVPWSIDRGFSPIYASNLKCHSTLKLCPSTQLLHWEILKCLGKIWRMRQKFQRHRMVKRCLRGLTRVLTQPWPLIDQGVSLGVVGDVFEVMAQVDCRLTKVNIVDRLIKVNKPGWKPGAS